MTPPTDEATSSVDPTSRLLVFKCGGNKTTIVITHDLTQIENGDFVYVMKEGRVIEQGFRYDLESEGGARKFRRIFEARLGGDVERDEDEDEEDDEQKIQEEEDEENATLKHQAFAAIRPLTFGNWIFDVVAELTGNNAYGAAETEQRTSILLSSTDQHTVWRCSKEDNSTAAGDSPETKTTFERNGSLLAYHRAMTVQLAPDDAYKCYIYHCESR